MRAAIAQIITGRDLAANLALVETYARQAKAGGADLVVFPEATMRSFGNSLLDIAEPLDGPWASRVRALAAELGVVIVAGMFTPGTSGDGAKVRNTLLVTGRGLEASYDKIHLFDAFGFAESDTVDAGTDPVTFELDGVRFGLATCYDIRFPGLFTENADRGADVNIVCASWGSGPGKADQWKLLARARALDSTTMVLACGQGDPASKASRSRAPPPPESGTPWSSPPWATSWRSSTAPPACSSPTWTPPPSRKPEPNSRSWPTATSSKSPSAKFAVVTSRGHRRRAAVQLRHPPAAFFGRGRPHPALVGDALLCRTPAPARYWGTNRRAAFSQKPSLTFGTLNGSAPPQKVRERLAVLPSKGEGASETGPEFC